MMKGAISSTASVGAMNIRTNPFGKQIAAAVQATPKKAHVSSAYFRVSLIRPHFSAPEIHRDDRLCRLSALYAQHCTMVLIFTMIP